MYRYDNGLRRALITIGITVTASLGLAACGTTDEGGHDGTHEATVEPEATFNAADVMFAQMMIPHHEQAVEMTELAPDRAEDPEVLRLAEKIKAAQDPEIELMTTWLTEWDQPLDPGGHDMAMGGMATPEQLADLTEAEGVEFDRMFVELMVAHHEGAIVMAEDVLANGTDPDVATLAEAIIQVQADEITELTAIQERL
ncbi:uncharacterized protein (DUF305 family) [Stackebrandtia endophytica]|uniref:Uncharacterized protein (DUF305 family) n=1 Tax=Stackebrandtia endophytica TaxID=1496996 RepID=A0A543B006_9ACTN|nr:DUF305 domain-containing protein [Stackebrandtia endophytica]TQL78172.1 uncharacterized protein (DUF305 family) [Stackebrandtia endophytica]